MITSTASEENEGQREKGGARWETKERRIRTRVGNRSSESRNKRKKGSWRSNPKELLDRKHSREVGSPVGNAGN